jgi:hypothetical protein
MSRIIGPSTLKKISIILSEYADEITYFGDLSDLGNELGKIISEIYPEMTEQEIAEFMSGFKHGVSSTNNTNS